MTNQKAADAIRQYRHDRDHRKRIFDFKKRTLVHFALDTEEVQMTTRLAGPATHFLPFNQGHDGGAGNPVDPAGRNYHTATFGMERHSLLEMFARYMNDAEFKSLAADWLGQQVCSKIPKGLAYPKPRR